MEALSRQASVAERRAHHAAVRQEIDSLLEGEDDFLAAMATVACELHHAFAYYHWTGFYRVTRPGLLVIGPYQGGHGCLRIEFARGVCGAAAREKRTQLVPDVHAFPDHIACSSTTRSEIVVPVLSPDGEVLAVLDVDSDDLDAFNEADREALEDLAAELGRRHAPARRRAAPPVTEGTSHAGLRVDHVVVPVFDVAATRRFYGQVLGLPLVSALSGDDWDGKPWLMMLYALGDGRQLVFCALHGAKRPAPDDLPDDTRHVALAVSSARELDAWKTRLAEHDVAWHEEDHGTQRSIYFKDPDGLLLEITTPASANVPASERTSAPGADPATIVAQWLARHRPDPTVREQ